MRIAVDAMGGDFAPREIVKGAVEAAKGLDGITALFLVGREDAIKAELAQHRDVPACIQIRHASETVEMDEHPAHAVRRKKDSSIGRSVDLVKAGEADAMISAGNTGAVVAAAMLKLRVLEGVTRPAIAAVLPTRSHPFVLIDAGANPDAPPEQLRDFAVMGSVYSHNVLGRPSPVVGLLSIGTEDIKGSDRTLEAFQYIEKANLNFKGNIEGHDLFEGETDVVVCDGFVGNVVLKTAESTAGAIAHWMKFEFTQNIIRKLGALLLIGAVKAMKRKLDPETYGGAPLLGVNGVCIITHGASTSKAIYHAIRTARESVLSHVNEEIVKRLKSLSGGGEKE
jgi:phosphate acyltransferase